MTDAAAGGQAALQLQQSMAAAPYVQQQTDAAVEHLSYSKIVLN
jgi:hypothetical protein